MIPASVSFMGAGYHAGITQVSRFGHKRLEEGQQGEAANKKPPMETSAGVKDVKE